jgi:dTDP-4-amino-4,6-dideoxygalactose transaminase
MGYKPSDLPESQSAALETIALPIYPELSEQQLRHVADSIIAFLQMGKSGAFVEPKGAVLAGVR